MKVPPEWRQTTPEAFRKRQKTKLPGPVERVRR